MGHDILSLVQGVRSSNSFSYIPLGGGGGACVILFCNIDREYKTQPDGIIAKHILKPVAFLLKSNFNKMHDFCFYTLHCFLKFWYLGVVTRRMLFHTATSRKVVRKNVYKCVLSETPTGA